MTRPKTTPHKAGAKYPKDVRDAATAYAAEHGAPAAATEFGIHRRTIERWCLADGVNLDRRAADVERMASARAALGARIAEGHLDRLRALEDTFEAARIAITDRLAVEAAIAQTIATLDPATITDAVRYEPTPRGPVPVLTDPNLRRIVDLGVILNASTAPMRDLEGVLTRSIHDIQLLRGDATENGSVTIRWPGMVRPNPDDDAEEPDADR